MISSISDLQMNNTSFLYSLVFSGNLNKASEVKHGGSITCNSCAAEIELSSAQVSYEF